MATITYTVTVASGTTQYGTGNRFYINGELAPILYLDEGNTYIFDQSDSSNAVGGVHQIAFSTNPNNSPAASYTTGVTSTGTPGSAGAKTTFVVAPVKSAEIIVDKDIPRSVLKEYIQNARDLASSLDREVFMGGWFNSDDSKYYLDNVIIVDNKEEALYIAESADQIAFFDLNTFEEVRTQDGIEQLKQDGTYRSELSERLGRDLEQARKRFEKTRRDCDGG